MSTLALGESGGVCKRLSPCSGKAVTADIQNDEIGKDEKHNENFL